MRGQIKKVIATFCAGIMLFGVVGCGSNYPTKADDISNGEQSKLTISTEIVTVADDAGIVADR